MHHLVLHVVEDAESMWREDVLAGDVMAPEAPAFIVATGHDESLGKLRLSELRVVDEGSLIELEWHVFLDAVIDILVLFLIFRLDSLQNLQLVVQINDCVRFLVIEWGLGPRLLVVDGFNCAVGLLHDSRSDQIAVDGGVLHEEPLILGL